MPMYFVVLLQLPRADKLACMDEMMCGGGGSA